MEVSSFLYFSACLCACVCLYVLVCVRLCVCIAFGLWTVAWIEFADFASCLQLALAHALSLSFTLSFSRTLCLLPTSTSRAGQAVAPPCLVLSMHSSTFTSCQRQRSWGNLWRRLPQLAPLVAPNSLVQPPHRSYLLRSMFALHFRCWCCCCCCCSCGTHFSQFSVHSATILHSHSARSTRSISTSFSLASSSSTSSLLACVSLCLFWYSLSACSTVRLSP